MYIVGVWGGGGLGITGTREYIVHCTLLITSRWILLGLVDRQEYNAQCHNNSRVAVGQSLVGVRKRTVCMMGYNMESL